MEEQGIKISKDPEVGINISETPSGDHIEGEIYISEYVSKGIFTETEIIPTMNIKEEKEGDVGRDDNTNDKNTG